MLSRAKVKGEGTMLMTTRGNLAEVRAMLGRDLEIGDVVDHSGNPTLAQIVPGKTPKWHVIETHPNRERTAAAHLIARRFGVFVPEKEETVVRRGRQLDQVSLMFRGYVFVFVWDIVEHINRIRAIPGVMRIVFVETANGAREPAVLKDDMIDQIRAVENTERPLPPIMIREEIINPSKKGRWTKKQKRLYEMQRAQLAHDNEIVGCRPWSAFQDGLMTLDGEGRNQTLRSALGLS
jgi:transcription antitermination factor NusG